MVSTSLVGPPRTLDHPRTGVSICLAPSPLVCRGRPCVGNEEGMSWQTADLLSADSTDVLAADTTDVLPADTTHVLPVDKFGVGNQTFAIYFLGFGPRPGMLGVGNPFSENMFQKHIFSRFGSHSAFTSGSSRSRQSSGNGMSGSSDPR